METRAKELQVVKTNLLLTSSEVELMETLLLAINFCLLAINSSDFLGS